MGVRRVGREKDDEREERRGGERCGKGRGVCRKRNVKEKKKEKEKGRGEGG